MHESIYSNDGQGNEGAPTCYTLCSSIINFLFFYDDI